MPKPKYLYDDRYDEYYPSDGIYDKDCCHCGKTCPIEKIDETGWCEECVLTEAVLVSACLEGKRRLKKFNKKKDMTLADHNKCCEIIREFKALIPDAGEVRIEPWLEPKVLTGGGICFSLCWWFYCDSPQISQSFWTLDELELFVHRKIHALKLLTVVTPTPEERWRKDCLRRAYGRLENEEMN